MRSGKIVNKSNPQKPVIQYDLNENKIAEYVSQHEASRQTDITRQTIGMCCNGKQKTSGGFIWKFMTKKSLINQDKEKSCR